MGKKALAIRSIEADTVLSACERSSDYTYSPDLEQMHALYTRRSSLLDRDTCETDLAWVQWLVYIRLSYEVPSATIENGVDQYVFLYQRGKAGGEARLHDDWSIGLGGHVEELPDPIEGGNLLVLAESAQRELIEEVGIELDVDVFAQALTHPIVMRDNRTPTEAVHLGLFIDIRVDPSKINMLHETNVIKSGDWVLLREVQERHASGGFVPRLEPWSVAFQRIPLPTAEFFSRQAG